MNNSKTTTRSKQAATREKKMGISEWSECERGEPTRNGEIPILKNFGETIPRILDPEVVEKPKRRRFSKGNPIDLENKFI
jgi:hypothetical protein